MLCVPFLLVVLVASTVSTKSQSHYFITTPGIYRAGEYASIVIHIEDLTNGAAYITTKLTDLKGNIVSKVTRSVTKTNEVFRIFVPYTLKEKAKLLIESRNGATFKHETEIQVKSSNNKIFIQTDKPMYKPGDKIRFRVVVIDKHLKPGNKQVSTQVYITNAGGSRVMQWSNITLDTGMVSLEMQLSVKPVLGTWKITAKYGATKTEHSIVVDKYVLPKFEVQIKSPSYLLKKMTEFPITICARYTYGKSVAGLLKATMCYSSTSTYTHRDIQKFCTSLSKPIDGCMTTTFDVNNQVFRNRYNSQTISLTINATVTEKATGVSLGSSHTTKPFLDKNIKLKFEAPKRFKPGFMFKVKLFITLPDDRPAIGKHITVKVSAKKSSGRSLVKTYIQLVKSGVFTFNVFPTNGVSTYHYEALYGSTSLDFGRYADLFRRRPTTDSKVTAFASSNSWYSPSNEFIQIHNIRNLEAGKKAGITVKMSEGSEVVGKSISYLLMCRGIIMLSSQRKVTHRHAHIHFTVRHEMLPVCRMVVYYIKKNGEFVADYQKLHFKMSYKNKVSVTFSDVQQKPGQIVNLTLKASVGSKFALSAVDRSVQLLGATSDLREEQIVSLLNGQDIDGKNFQKRTKCPNSGRCSRWFGCYYNGNNKYDGRRAIEDAGLIYFSNADVDLIECERRPIPVLSMEVNFDAVDGAKSLPNVVRGPPMKRKKPTKVIEIIPTIKKTVKKVVKIRTNFPETWIWSEETINISGEKIMEFKVPDTITTWYASGFAMSTTAGIGISSPASLQAFQPFFVSLTLPYSVIRGESVKVPSTVFNYLDDCLVIQLSLDISTNVDITSESSAKLCVCGHKSKAFKFSISPKKLGRVDITIKAITIQPDVQICDSNRNMADLVTAADAITRKLLVEAEGIKKEFSTSSFFCPRDHSGLYSDTLVVAIPQPVVPGSVYAELAVVGDLLGPSMDNLDKLLAMPYGCGEQNMLNFAPNIYIMDYLTATNQLNEKIETKAKGYMRAGYQRELTYKHSNGAFSAFGERDKEGSTWLTAFVLRSFSQAKRYIFIDDRDIEDSKRWLLSLQESSGCFKERGMVHHKEMKGGVTGGITMTAFVLNALFEAEMSHTDPRIQKALSCIAKSLNSISDPYTAAIISYTLSLAGSSKRETMLKKLDSFASQNDGFIHWQAAASSKKKPESDYYYHYQAPSADIEMTAYSLMAYIGGRKQFRSKVDHLKIVKWLVKQRNSFGGFSSTQDTCVGLQALSQYSAGAFAGDYALNVRATTLDGFTKEFEVRNDNKLVLQRVELPKVPSNVSIQATGDGCTLIQANVKYNIPNPKEETSFYLSVDVKDRKTFNCEHSMKVCGSYMKSGKSNMALIDVSMVSGFEPITSELDMIMQSTDAPFSYYEFVNGVLSFYFDDLDQSSTCVTFTMEQVSEVGDRKPASVKLYDYYDTDKSATKMYNVEKCPEMNAT